MLRTAEQSQTQVLTASLSAPIANFLLLMIFMATFLHVFLSKASFTSPQAPLQGKTEQVIDRQNGFNQETHHWVCLNYYKLKTLHIQPCHCPHFQRTGWNLTKAKCQGHKWMWTIQHWISSKFHFLSWMIRKTKVFSSPQMVKFS